MTRIVLAGPRSSVASARTVTAIVWVAALPPIEATIGMSTASATICSIEASKSWMTPEARIAVPRLIASQRNGSARSGRRFADAFVADAGEAPEVFVGLFLDDLDDVVDGDDADQPLVGVDDGADFRS